MRLPGRCGMKSEARVLSVSTRTMRVSVATGGNVTAGGREGRVRPSHGLPATGTAAATLRR